MTRVYFLVPLSLLCETARGAELGQEVVLNAATFRCAPNQDSRWELRLMEPIHLLCTIQCTDNKRHIYDNGTSHKGHFDASWNCNLFQRQRGISEEITASFDPVKALFRSWGSPGMAFLKASFFFSLSSHEMPLFTVTFVRANRKHWQKWQNKQCNAWKTSVVGWQSDNACVTPCYTQCYYNWVPHRFISPQWGTADARLKTPPHPPVGAQGYQRFLLFKPGIGKTALHSMLCQLQGPLAY